MSDNGNKIEHLKFIQNVITRMAGNSFLIKGWCIALITAVYLFSVKYKLELVSLLPLLIILPLWILDGYFLWQERLYRGLYDMVRKRDKESGTDFSMNASSVNQKWMHAIFSRTLSIFYGALIAVCLLLMLFTLAPTFKSLLCKFYCVSLML